MPAQILEARAELTPSPVLRVTIRAEDPLPPELFLSWQGVDAETQVVVAEGPRVPLHVSAGGSVNLEVPLDLPHAPGEYWIYGSLVEEGVAWRYTEGDPFLLLVVRVGAQGAQILSSQVLRWNAVKRRFRLRSFQRALTYPWRTILRRRRLMRSMVRRDLEARYRGSLLGPGWTLLNPLLLIVTYFFVFGVVLEARFPGDPSRSGFALYFLAGMLPWIAISEALGRAPVVVYEHGNLVKKLVFPVEILPVNLTLAGIVTGLLALLLFLFVLLALRGAIPVTALWIPVLLVPQALFTAGIGWFLAALGVYARDLIQINGYLLTLWFFLTPICYPEGALPESLAPVLERNPVYLLVRAYRRVLLEGAAPEAGPLLVFSAAAVVLFLSGHAFFYRLKRNFADVL